MEQRVPPRSVCGDEVLGPQLLHGRGKAIDHERDANTSAEPERGFSATLRESMESSRPLVAFGGHGHPHHRTEQSRSGIAATASTTTSDPTVHSSLLLPSGRAQEVAPSPRGFGQLQSSFQAGKTAVAPRHEPPRAFVIFSRCG